LPSDSCSFMRHAASASATACCKAHTVSLFLPSWSCSMRTCTCCLSSSSEAQQDTHSSVELAWGFTTLHCAFIARRLFCGALVSPYTGTYDMSWACSLLPWGCSMLPCSLPQVDYVEGNHRSQSQGMLLCLRAHRAVASGLPMTCLWR